MTSTQTLTKSVSQKLKGKVTLVTGSSRGIGAAIAQRLAADGAVVAINYSNSKDAAQQVADGIKKLGESADVFQANVSSENDVKRLIEEVTERFGKIDILINNAAIWEAKPLEQMDVGHYSRVFDVNVKAVIATTVAALPYMQDGGRIINISSGAGKSTMPGTSVYSASKAALDTLTRIWAQDLAARKITVNAVAPGTTATDMLIQALPEDVKNSLIGKTPLGRLGEPIDIAEVVAFVASHEGGWINGQTVYADGGLTV